MFLILIWISVKSLHDKVCICTSMKHARTMVQLRCAPVVPVLMVTKNISRNRTRRFDNSWCNHTSRTSRLLHQRFIFVPHHIFLVPHRISSLLHSLKLVVIIDRIVPQRPLKLKTVFFLKKIPCYCRQLLFFFLNSVSKRVNDINCWKTISN